MCKHSIIASGRNFLERHGGKLFRVGITGHRKLAKNAQYVKAAIDEHLVCLQDKHSEGILAISALAEGADTIFAKRALSLKIPLKVIIPFECYVKDFRNNFAKKQFQELLSQAIDIHHLPYFQHSKEAFVALGRWLVDNSDLLIAVWDERPARGRGGTGEVVQYACSVGRARIIINPVTCIIKNYAKEELFHE